MPTFERDVLLQAKDAAGNIRLLYPITKGANVDGTVSDAEKLGNVAAAEYALAADIPNVPNWAMQPTKPAYTASEVGALGATAQAQDAGKLGGQPPAYYATASKVQELDNLFSGVADALAAL